MRIIPLSLLALSLSACFGLAACGSDASDIPAEPTEDAGTKGGTVTPEPEEEPEPEPEPVKKCAPTCKADSECGNSCPAVPNAVNCCDLETSTCFSAKGSKCPVSDATDGGYPTY